MKKITDRKLMGFKIISHISKHAHYLFSVIFYRYLDILLIPFLINLTLQSKRKRKQQQLFYMNESIYISRLKLTFFKFQPQTAFCTKFNKTLSFRSFLCYHTNFYNKFVPYCFHYIISEKTNSRFFTVS